MNFSSSFQTFLLLQLLALIAPVFEAFPTGLLKPHLLLNELAINYGSQSFLELYASEAISSEFKDLHFGLLLIQPSSTRKKTVVRAIIDLPKLRQQPKTGAKYFVFGNPKAELMTAPEDQYMIAPLSPDPNHIRLFNVLQDKWLDVAEKELLMVILTCSKTESIISALDLTKSSLKVFLQDQSKLEDYIRKNTIDSLIVRGPGACRSSVLVEEYIPYQVKEAGTMLPFVMVVKAQYQTTNKCGLTDNPFTAEAYKEGPATPGQKNNCDGNRLSIETQLDNFIQLKPSSIDNLEDTCSSSFLEEDNFSSLTPEQLNVPVEENALINARSNSHPVCRPRDEIGYATAEVSNSIQRLRNKRLKIRKPWSDLCPGEIAHPLIRQRIRHNLEAEKFIEANTGLKEKLDPEVIKGKQWFQLIRDYKEPANSKFNCFYCSKYSREFRLKNKNNQLGEPEGIMGTKKSNYDKITSHESRKTHIKIMEMYRKKYLETLPDAIQGDILRSEKPEFHITNKHMR